MNRAAALIDAAMTVQCWQRQFPAWPWEPHVRHRVARDLRCEPTWAAIEDEIVRRNITESDPARLAA